MARIEVLPGIGFGQIRFGMTPKQVLALLTEPTKHERWMGGNLNDALIFHGLRFHFNRCNSYGPLDDSSLVELCICGREDAFLYNEPLFAWKKHDIGAYLEQLRLSPIFPKNGDIEVVDPYMAMSFDANEQLEWFATGRILPPTDT